MRKFIFTILCSIILTTGCSKNLNEEKDRLTENNVQAEEIQIEEVENKDEEEIKQIVEAYAEVKPTQWSEQLNGVVSNINNDNKEIALTLDACGGENGSKYDKELIDFLDKENINATLFINYRWIEANKDIFMDIAKNDNFQIQNHGYSHKPLSVNKNLSLIHI